MLDEEAFVATTERLQGQLELLVDKRDALGASQGTHDETSSVWLVFRPQRTGDRAPTLASALDAIHQLFHLAEDLRGLSSRYSRFWRRVFTSSMMLSSKRPGAQQLQRFDRQLGQRPIQVLVDASDIIGKPPLLEVLKAFLQRSRQSINHRQLVVGVYISRTRISTDEIELLASTLPRFNDTSSAMQFERLDFENVGLAPPCLQALTSLLDEHPVQELRMESALMRAALNETVVALRSVLKSFFSPGQNDVTTRVRLSLEFNSLDSRYYQALAYEINAGTRPLRSLCLARTLSITDRADREQCWTTLARIVYTSGQARGDCELDMSKNRITERDVVAFDRGLAHAVAERASCVAKVLADGKNVCCRIKWIDANPPSLGPGLGAGIPALYQVAGTDEGGAFNVLVDEANGSSWLPPSAISELHGECALSVRFDSLLLDVSDEATSAEAQWLASIGTNLRKLSIRLNAQVHTVLEQLTHACPQLTHLDIEGCRLYAPETLWDVVRGDTTGTLQSINASGNFLGAQGMEQLVQLHREIPDLSLRHLGFQMNHIGIAGLVHLDHLLATTTRLEVLELDGGIDNDLDGAYASQREHMTRRCDGEVIRVVPLATASRLAFLHALTRQTSHHAMDAPLLSLIIEFAARPVVRTLVWY